MKGVNESIFMSSLRALFASFFAVVGIAIAVTAICLVYYGLYSVVEEESLPSKVKVLPDAAGDRKKLASSTPVLLQITLDGEIGEGKLTGKEIQEVLLETREDALKDRVKGILLVINSPGGGVNDSDIIYRLVKQYKENYKIPIFAYVNGLCASGGYYIACATDKIYASHVSLIGSIGVLSWPPFVNLVDTMEKVGMKALTLTAGKGKDELNPFRTWQPDEQKNNQALLDYFYTRFVDIVATDRKIDKEILVHECGAKVYPAPQAHALGFIDGQGYSLPQALTELATAAGITQKYQVVGVESQSWWKKLMKGENHSPFMTGKIKHELALPNQRGNPFSYLFIP
jgi:protease-4